MLIVAEDGSGDRLAEFVLGHGDDPADQLRRRGLRLVRPIDASGANERLTLRLAAERDDSPAEHITTEDITTGTTETRDVTTGDESTPGEPDDEPDEELEEELDADRADRPHTVPKPGPPPPSRGRRPSETPMVVRQRIAAYAWVRSERGVLAAEFHRELADGRWTLPGGGVDPGEEPAAAVHREVMEETSQVVELGELAGVSTRHWVGRNHDGVLEDFHAVRLIYRAWCPRPTDPVVIDVGGTTSAARWFPYESWPDAPWTPGWRDLLISLFATDVPGGGPSTPPT